MDFSHSFLLVGHMTAAAVGTAAAFLAEILSFQALKDGVVDAAESLFLKTVFTVIRWSLIVLILTGAGLLIFARLSGAPFEAVYNGKFLAKLTIVLAIIFGPVLMQWRIMPTSVGGPIATVSWLAAFILGAWRSLDAAYFFVIAVYAAAVLAAILASNAVHRRFFPK